MSSNNSSRRGPRGGGRGRGRGGGGRRSGRGRSNKRSGDRNNNNSNNNNVASSNGSNQSPNMPGMRDEEILIAFMPFLKGDNQEATLIHERYQSSNDQPAFLSAARDFLAREKTGQRAPAPPSQAANRSHSSNQQQMTPPGPTPVVGNPAGVQPINFASSDPFKQNAFSMSNPSPPAQPFPPSMGNTRANIPTGQPVNAMDALERNMASLLSDDNDPVFGSLPIGGQSLASSSGSGSLGGSMFGASTQNAMPQEQRVQMQNQGHPFQSFAQSQPQPITPPRVANMPPSNGVASSSPFSSLFPANPGAQSGSPSPYFQRHEQQSVQQQSYSPPRSTTNGVWSKAPPPGLANPVQPTQPTSSSHSPKLAPVTPAKTVEKKVPASTPAEPPKTPARKEYQPKRKWTRLEEQPGKIHANNVAASVGAVVDLRPRQELKAQWILPLSYLREHATGRSDARTVRDLLENLAVGLFRRGCTENGAQASIVSKEILTPAGESRSDYPFQVMGDTIVGTVPFYSPRTPGHVVLRLYWQNEPLYTLATGPTLNVRVTENDFESSIRFILSNFKAKKVNPTSLSSLNSLSLVLEQFQLSQRGPQQGVQHQMEGAGRAVWGCICEARKVLDACASEYNKTTAKLEKLEEVVEELKLVVADEEAEKDKDSELNSRDDTTTDEEEPSENVLVLREKQKVLMSGRASCERKWRDSQLAFSSILRAVVTNPSMSMILRRELVTKLRLEYELWCPLSEEFAVPGDSESKMWYEPLNNFPHSITGDHFRFCTDARSKMQHRSLGFDPNTSRLDSILYPTRGRNRQMNPAAVNVFNQLSAAMGQLYQDNYATADRIIQQREMIRMQTEKFVNMCDCFPRGTQVAIFGSSANGFGSPNSDIDMCLQIPPGHVITTEEDPTGSAKMAKLAEALEEHGMKEVDTSRLTARIPVIKFNYPKPSDNGDGEVELMECDLSMHNPLAVLNTSLLRTYAEINPVPRVLAGVIKRWAKARDINNPARHTLSSYGYILMLLHFLTSHQRSGNGLVVSVAKTDKSSRNQALPLLPNLQWMDERWPESQQGTPYQESEAVPKQMMKHPMEDRGNVNAYFYRPNPSKLQNLQRLFPGQDLSLGILLASFFRYYAYEFNYKRNVVSLHSTVSHGLVEREVKAELDGWRNYSAALTIEDPFETFYDVAHVLRGGYYHRIRREFAVAYSKIADIASNKTTSTWNNKTVDLTKMVGMELIDWICEPVVTERDDASTQK